MHHKVSTLKIVKETAERYRYVLQGQRLQIDEIGDGPKLSDTLQKLPALKDSNGQTLRAADVFAKAVALEIGQGIDFEVVERVEWIPYHFTRLGGNFGGNSFRMGGF